MTHQTDGTKKTRDLSKRAEKVVGELAAPALESEEILPAGDMGRAFHDLQMHRVELERQNEELLRTEMESEAARARYYDLFDLAPLGYFTLSEAGVIIEANRMAATQLGLPRDALVQAKFTRFIYKDHQGLFHQFQTRLQQTSQPQDCDLRMVCRDKTPFWAHLEATVGKDAQGVSTFRVVMIDISKRKWTEDALQESESRLHRVAHSGRIAFFEWNTSGDEHFWSPEGYELFGVEPHVPATYERWSACLHPEDRERVTGNLEDFLQRALSGQQMGPLYQEYRVIHGDGTVLWLEDIESFDHEEGNLILRGIARDITGRRTAEETLREVEVKYQHLFEQMPLGFILGQVINDEEGLPRDLRVLNANAAFTQQTGLHRDAIVGRTLLELYPGDATAWIDWYRQSAKAGNPVQFETFIGPLNRSHEISAFKISSDHLGLFFKDVTERNQAQALATATEGILAKGQMAAYVAHEINNPLAGIKSAFLLLENAIPQDHPYFHYIGLIHKEITRISIIVKSMYELYRPSSAVPTHILLRALLEEVTIFLAPKARAQQASIQLDLPDSELRVTIYSDLLRQILFNLIQNALDASSPNGTVLCRALRRNDRLCIQVIDGGSGIAPEVAARIFNPGFSTKQAMGGQMGLGLGLGSSRRLAEGLGGSLTFTNNPSEVGCTFELDLPLENQDIPQEPNHEP